MNDIRQRTVHAFIGLSVFQRVSLDHGKSSWNLMMLLLFTQAAATHESAVTYTTVKNVTLQPNSTDDISSSFKITEINNSTFIPSLGEVNMNLNQDILRQFDQVDGNLRKLVTMFSADESAILKKNIEAVGFTRGDVLPESPPRGERFECNVSRDDLIELKNVVNFTSSATTTQSLGDCVFNSGQNSSDCAELVKLIQCGVRRARNGYEQATSSGEQKLWINALTTLQRESQKQLDNLNRTLIEAHKSEISNLVDDIQNLTKLLTERTTELTEYGERIIEHIANGRINEASQLFQRVLNEFSLSRIVRSVYNNHGGAKTVVSILDFIDKFPSCSIAEIAYRELYKVMNLDKRDIELYPNPPETLLIYSNVGRDCRFCTALEKLRKDLVGNVEMVFKIWLIKINRNNDFEEVIDYALMSKLNDIFSHMLPDMLVPNVLLDSQDKAMTLIDRLPCMDLAAASILSFYESARRICELRHLSTLAYKVNQFKKMGNFRKIDQRLQDGCTAILNHSSSLSNLTRNGSRCTVRSRDRAEYLFGSGYTNNNNQQYAFTWIPGNVDSDMYWEIETGDSGRSFTFRNIRHNKYLFSDYSNGVSLSGEKRYLTTSWEIRSTGDGQYLRLMNTKNGGYLYSRDNETYDSWRRYVFTDWSKYSSESNWIISCEIP